MTGTAHASDLEDRIEALEKRIRDLEFAEARHWVESAFMRACFDHSGNAGALSAIRQLVADTDKWRFVQPC